MFARSGKISVAFGPIRKWRGSGEVIGGGGEPMAGVNNNWVFGDEKQSDYGRKVNGLQDNSITNTVSSDFFQSLRRHVTNEAKALPKSRELLWQPQGHHEAHHEFLSTNHSASRKLSAMGRSRTPDKELNLASHHWQARLGPPPASKIRPLGIQSALFSRKEACL